MNVKSKKDLRVLWAIDILAIDKKVKASAELMLRVLSKRASLKINPTYVLRLAEQLQPMSRGEGPKIILENVQSAMARWLSNVKVNLEAPKALLQKGVYLRSDIDGLVAEAKKVKADLILVNTHARKGFSRFWMGSFAETLMHHSPLPLLFLNPSSKPLTEIKTLICPVSLSPQSQKTIRKAGEWAALLKAQLVLYNNVEYFVSNPGLAFTETMVFSENLEKDGSERKKTLEKWGNRLKKELGLKVSVELDESASRVSDGILKLSKKMPSCMIAMNPETGPILSVLVGSTTRRVVREATVPVLVFR